MKENLQEFVQRVEKSHFRTNQDTGANHNAILIWNMVREFAGLSYITRDDLPAWCEKCKKYYAHPCSPERK